jgi:ribonuclease P protein component
MDGPLFLLVAAENPHGFPRLGLAAGKRAGGAAQRNRAKRLLREAFRRSKPPANRALDLVFVPKRELALRSLEEVEHEYRERLQRLEARRGRAARPRPAAAR